MADLIANSKSYQELLGRLKNQIRTAQVRAALAVNQELVLLYWGIGKEILAEPKLLTSWAKIFDKSFLAYRGRQLMTCSGTRTTSQALVSSCANQKMESRRNMLSAISESR